MKLENITEKEFVEEVRVALGRSGDSKIGIDTHLKGENTADIDSLDVVETIMYLEEKYNVTIPDDTAETFQTIRDAYSFVKNYKFK
jgi:acyl carrier protein